MIIAASVFYLVRTRQIEFEIARSRGLPSRNSATLTVLADDTGAFTESRANFERAADILSDPHMVPLPPAVWSAMALLGTIGAMRLLNWARAA